jgi:CheY-like chemotaxis protein
MKWCTEDPRDGEGAGAGRTPVLLVEDNPVDARLVEAVIAAAGRGAFTVERTGSLGGALERLAETAFGAVLLDLSLPDAGGLDALRRIRAALPDLAVVVLTGRDDRDTALQAVQEGAQDYLVKMELEGELLVRSLRYAVERQRLLAEIRALSLDDELTGLRNRRGFFALAEQQLLLASRSGGGWCCSSPTWTG